MCVLYIRNGWVRYFCQSKRKGRTWRQHGSISGSDTDPDLMVASWSCLLYLGKSVLSLTSCSADMNDRTLNLSKQAYCMVSVSYTHLTQPTT